MKTAIMILSDPKNGSEEALGRVFNALALALAGTAGLLSLRRYLAEGWQTVVF